MRCDEIRELAPEIALGIADGEERAEALRHLSTCAECRRAVERLSGVADELLLMAPAQEPPAGFESRVVKAIGLDQPESRRRLPRWLSLRWLAPRLGPALAAAAVTAVVLVSAYSNDREIADQYRDTLDRAGGQSFQAERLSDETGARAGVAFGYQGSPSWLFLTVNPEHRGDVKSAELVTKDGRKITIPELRLDRGGTWGGAIPTDLYRVQSVRLLGNGPGDVLQASFPAGPEAD
jgi:Putative zinc-finger